MGTDTIMERLRDKAFRDEFLQETIAVQLGAQLRMLRVSRGMTVEALAELADCSPLDVEAVEKGDGNDTELGLLMQFAEIFDVGISARFVSFPEALQECGYVPSYLDQASGIAARSDETAQQAQPEARARPEGDAQTQSHN